MIWSILLMLLPTNVVRLLLRLIRVKRIKISRNCKIGFSYINCRNLVMEEDSHIGHFNIISTNSLKIRGGENIALKHH